MAMLSVSELDAIYATYELTRDGYKIVRKACSQGNTYVLANTMFSGKQSDDIAHSLDECASYIEEVTVISLWASFENSLREHVKGHFSCVANSTPGHYFLALHEKTLLEVEYWKFDDLLDLLKTRLASSDVGQAKQIKRFRDWIAHGKPAHKATPAKVPPGFAWKVLRTILSAL